MEPILETGQAATLAAALRPSPAAAASSPVIGSASPAFGSAALVSGQLRRPVWQLRPQRDRPLSLAGLRRAPRCVPWPGSGVLPAPRLIASTSRQRGCLRCMRIGGAWPGSGLHGRPSFGDRSQPEAPRSLRQACQPLAWRCDESGWFRTHGGRAARPRGRSRGWVFGSAGRPRLLIGGRHRSAAIRRQLASCPPGSFPLGHDGAAEDRREPTDVRSCLRWLPTPIQRSAWGPCRRARSGGRAAARELRCRRPLAAFGSLPRLHDTWADQGRNPFLPEGLQRRVIPAATCRSGPRRELAPSAALRVGRSVQAWGQSGSMPGRESDGRHRLQS